MKVNMLAIDRQGHVSSIPSTSTSLAIAGSSSSKPPIELGVEEQTIKKDLGRVLLETGGIAGPADQPSDEPQGTIARR